MLKKKNITIRDVARQAHVSYQTVSRVLNGSENVAEQTRQQILHVVAELGYTPNKIARMLTTNQSHTLELIIVDAMHDGRLAESIKNMAFTARAADYNLLVTTTSADRLGTELANANALMVDGVILYAPALHISDEQLVALCPDMPLVRRDYVPDSHLAWVGFDQAYSTRKAIEYLVALGHRQIAAVTLASNLINGAWRYRIWRQTLLEHHLQPGPVYEAENTSRAAALATEQLLAAGEPFTALMVGSDSMALGALHVLHQHGLRVPNDISVISFDNAELSAFCEPPLTTIDFNFIQQDTIAVKYLLDLLNDPEMQKHQRILLPELIVRESTRAINAIARDE